MTIEEQIEAVLFAHTAAMSLEAAPPLAWPNVDFTPPDDGPYVEVLHLPNRNTRIVLKGTGPHLRQGILQLTVVAPLNGGPSVATALAGAIAETFPADLELFDEDIKVRIQKTPDLMPADKTDVSWNRQIDIYYETFA